MRSSLLCLALLFASTCCETNQTSTNTDVTTEMGTTESQSTQSSDYDYESDNSTITPAEQPITKVVISSEPTTITTTTTTKAAEPKVTCPTCVTCVQAIVGDNSMLVILALAVACLFLLITTMALACKVCSLKREQGEYQPCHAADDDESHLANGKSTKTDTGGKNDRDNAVMMTEVFSENETTATEEKGSKQEEDGASTGSSQNSSEGKDGSDESPSDAAVNDDQANTYAMEAPKDPAVSETANVTDVSGSGSGAAGEPASSSTEETPANVEG